MVKITEKYKSFCEQQKAAYAQIIADERYRKSDYARRWSAGLTAFFGLLLLIPAQLVETYFDVPEIITLPAVLMAATYAAILITRRKLKEKFPDKEG